MIFGKTENHKLVFSKDKKSKTAKIELSPS